MSSVSSGRISVTVDRGTAHGVASGPHRLRLRSGAIPDGRRHADLEGRPPLGVEVAGECSDVAYREHHTHPSEIVDVDLEGGGGMVLFRKTTAILALTALGGMVVTLERGSHRVNHVRI